MTYIGVAAVIDEAGNSLVCTSVHSSGQGTLDIDNIATVVMAENGFLCTSVESKGHVAHGQVGESA